MKMQRRIKMFSVVGICPILIAIVVGCEHGPERVVVEGAVTFQGEAIPRGTICFVPCEGTEGPSVTEEITDGRYKVKNSGGLPVGGYQVAIRAFRYPTSGTKSNVINVDSDPVPYIPKKYNVNTELKIKVKSGRNPATHDFQLTM